MTKIVAIRVTSDTQTCRLTYKGRTFTAHGKTYDQAERACKSAIRDYVTANERGAK